MTKLKITKAWLEAREACEDGVEFFEKHDLEGKELVDVIRTCKEGNELDYALWLWEQSEVSKELSVKLAVYSAELVLHIWEDKCPSDDSPRKAIESAKDWLENPGEETVRAARRAACAAWVVREAREASAAVCAAWVAGAASTASAASAAACAAWAARGAREASAAASDKILDKMIELLEND